MKRPDHVRSVASLAALAAALLLPSLSLVPLGGLWLWQHGLLLQWAVAAALVVATIYVVERWFFRRLAEPRGNLSPRDPSAPDQGWTPAEASAWDAVQAVAAGIDADRLDSRDAVLALGRETIEVVARRLNPELADPVWQFTLPEAFGIAERVSRRLGRFAATSLPLSDRLTVAQVLALYRWRGVAGVAERVYYVWRVLRVANPMTAATQELRERLARQMLAWGQAHVTERLARAYVEEVGRAAIDLYGGRLRAPLTDALTPEAEADVAASAARALEPLRILVAGQSPAVTADVALALGVDPLAFTGATTTKPRDIEPYVVAREGLPSTHLLVACTSPTDASPVRSRLVSAAEQCDLIIWVAGSKSANGLADRAILEEIRVRFAAMRDRREPPLLVVLAAAGDGHIDDPTHDAIASSIGFAATSVVELASKTEQGETAPKDALWARIASLLPAAIHARTSRLASAHRRHRNWRRTWRQAVTAGRSLVGSLRTK